MELALQMAGALTVLAPFVLLQLRRTTTRSPWYLALNLAGSALLTWLAVLETQWGFVILEGAWAVAAMVGLVRTAWAGGNAPEPG